MDQLLTGQIKPERGSLNGCMLVGTPKPELVEAYKNANCNLIRWMEQRGVSPSHASSISFYFPVSKNVFLSDECYINIRKPSLEQANQIIEVALDELLDVYEVTIPPALIDRLVGVVPDSERKFSFENLLYLLKHYNQTEIGVMVNRSRQTICDLKMGRKNPTLEIVQSLMKEFPLLPWQSLLMRLELK